MLYNTTLYETDLVQYDNLGHGPVLKIQNMFPLVPDSSGGVDKVADHISKYTKSCSEVEIFF